MAEENISGLTSTPLSQLISIGESLEYLLRINHHSVSTESETYKLLAANDSRKVYSRFVVVTAIKKFLEQLKQHGLMNTLGTAEQLAGLVETIEEFHKYNPKEFNNPMKEEWANRLLAFTASVHSTLRTEATSRQMVELDLHSVTQPIATLPETLNGTPLEMQDWQFALWEDTLRCLQTRAYRPAIIIGWALFYDIIRYWIYRDESRKNDFNQELKNRQGIEISEYEDFFPLKELVVLDYCRIAQGSLKGFTDKTMRSLQVLLDERNEFAHANFRQATAPVAQAHLERLIAIVSSPPFLKQ